LVLGVRVHYLMRERCLFQGSTWVQRRDLRDATFFVQGRPTANPAIGPGSSKIEATSARTPDAMKGASRRFYSSNSAGPWPSTDDHARSKPPSASSFLSADVHHCSPALLSDCCQRGLETVCDRTASLVSRQSLVGRSTPLTSCFGFGAGNAKAGGATLILPLAVDRTPVTIPSLTVLRPFTITVAIMGRPRRLGCESELWYSD